MSKREHSISVRFTDEEFDKLNAEYQEQLARVLDGVNFSLSSMIRIRTLRHSAGQDRLCKTAQDIRRAS
jgi:hypothetical protein